MGDVAPVLAQEVELLLRLDALGNDRGETQRVGQGFLMARPMAADLMVQWLTAEVPLESVVP